MFDFRLKVFYTVAKRLNLTKAAEELFITQPAVSKHIQEIENHLKFILIMCPVIKMNFKFIKITQYDELLTVKTRLKAIKGVRIWFDYKLYNEQNELINEAETELAFVGLNDWKPCKAPDALMIAINKKIKYV